MDHTDNGTLVVNRQEMQARLDLLTQQLSQGREQLQLLEEQRTRLAQTVLRIEGAVQVLREMLEPAPQENVLE